MKNMGRMNPKSMAYGTKTSKTKKKKGMNINVTEQTTTFPCPVNKLKGQLFDNLNMKWTTDHGEFLLDPHAIQWIMDNVKTSMFNNDRCYIYNKAFAVWSKRG